MAGSTAFGKFLSFGIEKDAQHSRNQAQKISRKQKIFQAGLRRRAFLRNARAAVASNLSAGTVLGLDSSAFRGVQASLQTQKDVGIADDLQNAAFGRRIDAKLDSAINSDQRAGNAGFAGDMVQEIVTMAGV